MFIYTKANCQCVNKAHCQCVYLQQGLMPVCLSTTRLTDSVLTSLTASVLIYNKAHCQCVNKAYFQCVYLQQGLLPVCWSTTRLTGSVFIYNKATAVLTRLTASVDLQQGVFIYKKVYC